MFKIDFFVYLCDVMDTWPSITNTCPVGVTIAVSSVASVTAFMAFFHHADSQSGQTRETKGELVQSGAFVTQKDYKEKERNSSLEP